MRTLRCASRVKTSARTPRCTISTSSTNVRCSPFTSSTFVSPEKQPKLPCPWIGGVKNVGAAPVPPAGELSRQVTTGGTFIDIMALQAAYANLHPDRARAYLMQRQHDLMPA